MIRPINKTVPLNVCIRHFLPASSLCSSCLALCLCLFCKNIVLCLLPFFLVPHTRTHILRAIPSCAWLSHCNGYKFRTRFFSLCCRFARSFHVFFLLPRSILRPAFYLNCPRNICARRIWCEGGGSSSSSSSSRCRRNSNEKQTKTKIIINKKREEIERTAEENPHLRVYARSRLFLPVCVCVIFCCW